jgi:ethanolamine utilization protein EutP (predicted NTPase)
MPAPRAGGWCKRAMEGKVLKEGKRFNKSSAKAQDMFRSFFRCETPSRFFLLKNTHMYNQISTTLACLQISTTLYAYKVMETFISPKYAAAVAVSGAAVGVVVEGEAR